MKIQVRPADAGGCGHYRMIWPAQALQKQGADVDITALDHTWTMVMQDQYETVWDEQQKRKRTFRIPHVVDVEDDPGCDVLVMQRPLRRQYVEVIEVMQRKGVRVVVELDDDFEAVSSRNVAWKDVHPRMSPDRNYLWLREAVQRADVVTVSTRALYDRYARYAKREPVILQNCVPEAYTRLAPIPHEGFYIGWSGSVETHPDDLQQTGGAVASIARKTGAQIAVVGKGEGVHRNLSLGRDQELRASGWVPIRDYPLLIAQIDLGIVPLDLTAFNNAKSWLKGLEFASLRIPYVASPTDPYRLAFAGGAGRLARRPQEWAGQIRRLIEDDDHRAQVIAGGYEFARHWTYEKQAERWFDAWKGALQ